MFLSNLIPKNNKRSKNTCREPTIIQFYKTCLIDFTKEEVITKDGIMNTEKNVNETATTINSSAHTNIDSSILLYEEIPEYNNTKLGIWNIHISNNKESLECIELLLKDVIFNNNNNKSSSSHLSSKDDSAVVVILTIDLCTMSLTSEIQLQQQMDLLISDLKGLISCLSSSNTGTTDLKMWEEGVTFGRAEIVEHINNPSSPNNNTKGSIDLMITVVMPSNPPTTFREKQIQSLLCYHLVKYSYELNCTLAFISDQKNKNDSLLSSDQEQEQQYLTINQLRQCLHSIISPSSNHNGDDEQQLNATILSSPSLYTPNNYHPEVLFGLMQRNASWDGHWDASTDSLSKILSPPTKATSLIKKQTQDEVELEEEDTWLKRVQSSVVVVSTKNNIDIVSKQKVLVPIISKKKEKDINNFFNKLL